VDNIEQALAGAKAKGLRLIDERPRIGFGGSKIAFVHPAGMHGVLLELVEVRNRAQPFPPAQPSFSPAAPITSSALSA